MAVHPHFKFPLLLYLCFEHSLDLGTAGSGFSPRFPLYTALMLSILNIILLLNPLRNP